MSGLGKRERTRWGLEELVAFECALAKDEGEEWQVLKEQDEEMAIDSTVLKSGDRSAIASLWLKQRLEKAPEIKLAADSVAQSLGAAGQLLGALALLSGLGSATAALAYTGDAPINVSTFFSVFVLLQALLAGVLLLVFLLPVSWRERVAFGPLFRATRWILELIFARLQSLSARFLSGKQRQGAAEWAGAARRSLSLHGSVAKWVAFAKIQAAALCFNLGVLLALLVAVAFTDRAFGWQTTLDASSSSVSELAQAASLPWAWLFGEGVGFPSEEQISGSRIVLKEGIQGLETVDLAVWWKFLALGVFTYGILPRALFYVLGKWQVRASLGRYDFRNASAERLMQRLRPEAERFSAERVDQGADKHGRDFGQIDGALLASQRVRCLCSMELGESFDLDALRSGLAQRWRVSEAAVEVSTYRDGRIADAIGGIASETQVAVVFESWMPPIREIERQVRDLRLALDQRSLIKLVLLGIPATDSEAVSLRPETQYAEAWHSFVRRMGDAYLILDNPAV